MGPKTAAGHGPHEPHCQPGWVWSRDRYQSSQSPMSPCISQLHWLVWWQWWDILMSGSGSKHLLVLLGHGLASSGMAQCGLQGEMRIPTSLCPSAFSLLLHLHVSLPPLSTTQSMCPHLAPKITPGRGQVFPSSTAMLRLWLMLPEPEGGDAPKSPGSTRQTQPRLSTLGPSAHG